MPEEVSDRKEACGPQKLSGNVKHHVAPERHPRQPGREHDNGSEPKPCRYFRRKNNDVVMLLEQLLGVFDGGMCNTHISSEPSRERFAVPHPKPVPQDVRREFSYGKHQTRWDEFKDIQAEKHPRNKADRGADNEYRRRDDRVLVGEEELYEEFNAHSFLVYRFHAR